MGNKVKILVMTATVIAMGVSFIPSRSYAADLTVNSENNYVENAEKLGKLDRVTVNYKQFLYEEMGGKLKAVKYLGSDTIVDIPSKVNDEPVTEVADDVFDDAKQENLTKITEFRISGKLQTISSKAFTKLSNLQKITLNDSFDSNYNCKDGVLVDSRNEGTLICYPQAKADTELYSIPSDVKKIGDLAFYNASAKLSRIFIHDKVSEIASDAFNDAKLQSIGVNPGNVTYFSDFNDVNDSGANKSKAGVLYKKISDTDAEIAKYPQNRPGKEFATQEVDQYNNVKARASITMGGKELKVTNVGDYAFQGVTVMAGFDMGSILTSIGNHAFEKCINPTLSQIIIPTNVTKVGEFAFNNCTSLQKIIIAGGTDAEMGVNNIGKGAFNNCIGLTSINVEGKNAYCNSLNGEKADGILYKKEISQVEDLAAAVDPITGKHPMKNVEKDILVRFPCSKKGNVTDSNFSLKDSAVTEVSDYAFQGLQFVSEISLSKAITKAGEGVFADCTNLTKVTDYDSVTDLGAGAFENCQKLTSPVLLPANLEMVNKGLFKNCQGLTAVQIPTNIRYISDTAFDGCKSLTTITIPKRAVDDKSEKFIYKAEDKKEQLPNYQYETGDDGVLYINMASVYSLMKYPMGKTEASYTIKPDINGVQVSSIMDYAFKDCPNLKEVKIIKKVHTNTDYPEMTEKGNPIGISQDVFDQDCNISFTTQVFDEECFNYDTVDNGTHIIITKLLADADTVYIPSKIAGKPVTQIAEGTFEGRKIKTLIIPASITSISNNGSAVDKIQGLMTLTIDPSNTYYKADGIKAAAINGNGGTGNDGGNGTGVNTGTTGQQQTTTTGQQQTPAPAPTGDNRGLVALGSLFAAAVTGIGFTKKKKISK